MRWASVATSVGVLLVAASPARGLPVEFTAPDHRAVGTAPRSPVIADFDGDGDRDLAVANSGDDNVAVLAGAGDGTLGAPVLVAVGNDPRAIAAATFNTGSDPDLALTNFADDDVSILYG